MKALNILSAMVALACIVSFSACNEHHEHENHHDMAVQAPAPPDYSQLVNDFLTAMDANDSAKLASLVAPGFMVYHPNEPAPVDIAKFFGIVKQNNAVVSGMKHTAEEVISTANAASSRGIVTGKHTGKMGDMPATGNDLKVEWLALSHVADGKMTDLYVQFNQVKFLTGLGMMPAPGAKPAAKK
jgi:predicted ester cyclase